MTTSILTTTPNTAYLFNADQTTAAGRKQINRWRSASTLKNYPQYVDSLSVAAYNNYQDFLASPLYSIYSGVSAYQDSLAAAQSFANNYKSHWFSFDSLVNLRDSILGIADSLTFTQQSQVNILTTLINNNASTMGSLFTQYHNKLNNAANQLQTTLATITPADPAEQATLDYLNIAVNGLMGDGYTSTDIAMMDLLADQCLEDYGLAVIAAYSLHASWSYQIRTLDNCISGNNLISYPSTNFDVKVSPNPSNQFTCLEISGGISQKSYDIAVIDIMGRVLYAVTSEESHYCFDLKDYQTGVYFIRVVDAQGQVTNSQFVISH
jgi:hypothetical protein